MSINGGIYGHIFTQLMPFSDVIDRGGLTRLNMIGELSVKKFFLKILMLPVLASSLKIIKVSHCLRNI